MSFGIVAVLHWNKRVCHSTPACFTYLSLSASTSPNSHRGNGRIPDFLTPNNTEKGGEEGRGGREGGSGIWRGKSKSSPSSSLHPAPAWPPLLKAVQRMLGGQHPLHQPSEEVAAVTAVLDSDKHKLSSSSSYMPLCKTRTDLVQIPWGVDRGISG